MQVQGGMSLRCRPPAHTFIVAFENVLSASLFSHSWHKAACNHSQHPTRPQRTIVSPTLSHTSPTLPTSPGPSPTGMYGRSSSRPSSAARNGGVGGSYGSSGGYNGGYSGGGGYSPGSSGDMQGPGGAGGKVPLSQKLAATKAAYMQRSTPDAGFVSMCGGRR